MRSFFFKLHGCDPNPDHKVNKVQVDAESENEACTLVRDNAARAANRWRVPVEIMYHGKSIDIVFPG